MLVEKILKNIQDYPTEKKMDIVYFEWFEQNKKILRKTSEAGEDIRLRLNASLCDGDVLFEDEAHIITASLKPCELIHIPVADIVQMGEVCFVLGNRHLPLVIDEKHVRVPYDTPTFEYLKKLGFACTQVLEKFNHFHEVKAHGHSHGESHDMGHHHGHD